MPMKHRPLGDVQKSTYKAGYSRHLLWKPLLKHTVELISPHPGAPFTPNPFPSIMLPNGVGKDWPDQLHWWVSLLPSCQL